MKSCFLLGSLFHSYNHTPSPDSHHPSILKMKLYRLSLYPVYFLFQMCPTFWHKQFPPNTAFNITWPAWEWDCDSLLVIFLGLHTPLVWFKSSKICLGFFILILARALWSAQTGLPPVLHAFIFLFKPAYFPSRKQFSFFANSTLPILQCPLFWNFLEWRQPILISWLISIYVAWD